MAAGTSNQTDTSCIPFSSSSNCQWNVFLSFRGKDTRKNFTGHLYAALDQAGIRTFKDDPELPRGGEISPELLQAIQDSSISIVIFSKNYASSTWCLDELVKILECKKTMGQRVLPVFYDVDPWVIRYQKETFAEAFEKHKKRLLNDMDRVDKWRAALTEAANLSGYDLKNDANGDEAKLIQEIVKDIQVEVNPKRLNVPEHLIGIDSRIDDMNSKLSIGSNDVRFIGIYGMGGVGKTTFAKAVYNRFFHYFESSCFLENVRENSEKPNDLRCLQEQLISEILKIKDIKVRSVDNGIHLMKDRLRSKRVLIVLDDLDKFSQLTSLARYQNWFGAGSRIIITTRYERLLEEVQVDVRYELMELNYYESLELFSCHAFKKNIPREEFMKMSKEVVKYAGGLPLALEVLGSYLFGRTMMEWKSAFEKLKKIPHTDVQKILRISYDALDDDDIKEIFLDIACFFIGRDKDEAMTILDACGIFPIIGISILRERCLLKIDDKQILRMHNLIRDMGRDIVRSESEKPGKHSRLWCQREACEVLEKNKGTKRIKGIILDLSSSEQLHFDTKTFERMHNLRFLEINNVHLFGSFENVFEELRWLCWRYCSLKCLPSSFLPNNLVILDMSGSKVDILWEGTKCLQNLKILNVCSSECLTTTPDFSGVQMLEKLFVAKCKSLLQVHPSIGLLAKLVNLDFWGCSNLKILPEQLGNMEGLRELNAGQTAIEQLPDSIGRLDRLVQLDLSDCKNLRNLPSSICYLASLEVLNLHGCSNLEKLPDELGNMKCLRRIHASYTAIEQLPESIGRLSSLVDLYLIGCKQLKNLPSSICNLISLRRLYLSNCWNLEKFPDSIRLLKNLEALSLDGCNTRIFVCSSNSPILSEGDMSDWITSLDSLIELSLGGTGFQSLPSSLAPLLSLKSLVFENCTHLVSLPELPPNLKNLNAAGCRSMENLPNLSNLKHLGNLFLENCRLQSLPELPPNLQGLDLTNMCSLQSLPKLPPDLRCLSLSGCNSLQLLPELPRNLEYLDASGCTLLEKPHSLEHLILTGCSNLAITYQDCLFPGCSIFGTCNIYLPSRETPGSHHKRGASISFDFPPKVEYNLLGMVLWVVYVNKEKPPIRAIINNKADGTEWYCCDWPKSSEVHSWWRYLPIPISMKSGDTIEVSFDRFIYGIDVMVETCGVYLVHKPDITEIVTNDCKIAHDIDLPETSSSKRLKV